MNYNSGHLNSAVNTDFEEFMSILGKRIPGFSPNDDVKNDIQIIHIYLYAIKDVGLDFFELNKFSDQQLYDFKQSLHKFIEALVDALQGEFINFSLKMRFSFDVSMRLLYEYTVDSSGEKASFSEEMDRITKTIRESTQRENQSTSSKNNEFRGSLNELREKSKKKYWHLSDQVHGRMYFSSDKSVADDLSSIFLKKCYSNKNDAILDCLETSKNVYLCILSYLILTMRLLRSKNISVYKTTFYTELLSTKTSFSIPYI